MQMEKAPENSDQHQLEQECARQTSRARLGLVLATLGAALVGGGLVEATVLKCSTLNISIVLGVLAVGMALLIGGGVMTGISLFATRRLGTSLAAQQARRQVMRFYVVIFLLVVGVLAMAYAITHSTESARQAGCAANGTAQEQFGPDG